ncbi:MAG: acetyl-CoA carboxylase carboxyltransferase subunit beta [Ruminiclostridium sp.]|nr:acetyl-CoA carboxylase carboxyltransferase subunit beta [Ruminiclostridium sp.]
MAIQDLFKVVKDRSKADTAPKTEARQKKNPARVEIPTGLLFKCPRCGTVVYRDDFERNKSVCVSCNYHSRIGFRERLEMTADPGTFTELDAGLATLNPIDFPGYEEKISELRKACGMNEAVITGVCTIHRYKCVIGIMDSNFMMASMGSVVGEKITRAFEYATANKLPVVLFTASGGARMQEGIISLMQMAKTSGAIARHSEAGQLYITVMTDPTTGGVTASFASLGDVIIAEPKVLIGFAGRRVIEGTIKQKLPDDFQSAEFMLENGFVDMIVERKNMRPTLSKLFRTHNYTRSEEYKGGAES